MCRQGGFVKALRIRPRLALLAVLAIGFIIPITAGREKRQAYSPNQKEFYLEANQLTYIQPGLKIEIQKAEVVGDQVRVTFRLKDDSGAPLDRAGIATPGTVSPSFVISRIEQGQRQYTAYATNTVTSAVTNLTATQPTSDAGGVYERLAEGEYRYTFGRRLPAGFDKTVTHTVGMYGSRNLTAFGMETYVDNDVNTFVPDGSKVTVVRDVVRTATCNSRCHDPLQFHGGGRRKVELCILCHQTQNSDPDTGNSVNFPVLIHKIHMGARLPSVVAGGKYQIIGNAQRVFDYSDNAFPANVQNCQVCHDPASGAAQSDAWLNANSTACGACHDNVNFRTGEGHGLGGVQVSDAGCPVCHAPDTGREFDVSVKGAHVLPERSSQLAGVNFEILSVDGTSPGSSPTVRFKVSDNKGNLLEPARMDRLRLSLGGPTNDSMFGTREDARQATAASGAYTYKFTAAIPASATGTFVVGAEGFRDVKLAKVNGEELTARDSGSNKLFYFGVTDRTPTRRRTIVSQAKCNACHEKLNVHSQSRDNVEYCSVCHRPGFTDDSERPADKRPAEAMDFKNLIHKIHTGRNLENEFTIYDAGSPENFNKVRFPGDRRNCSKCHEGTSYQLPLPTWLMSSLTPRGFFSPTPPATTACLGCHDSRSTAAHAFVNTAPFGESCATCHGEGSEFAVTRVHAR
jgi:OmcA/MtrC family decaheme c-type cytochrome